MVRGGRGSAEIEWEWMLSFCVTINKVFFVSSVVWLSC